MEISSAFNANIEESPETEYNLAQAVLSEAFVPDYTPKFCMIDYALKIDTKFYFCSAETGKGLNYLVELYILDIFLSNKVSNYQRKRP